jgi:hypothetical protein
MTYAIEMGSGAIIYIPSFIKIGSDIQKLIRGVTDTQRGDRINLLPFFQNKESSLKIRKFSNSLVPMVSYLVLFL